MANVRVAGQYVGRHRQLARVLVLDAPVLLRVGAHLDLVVQPARRNRANVVNVEEHVPAAGRVPLAVGAGRVVVVDVGARVLHRLDGRQELRRQPVPDARVEVADMLRDHDSLLDAHRDGVEGLAQQHVGVDVEDVVGALRLLRVHHPLHDGARLVVRGRRVLRA